MSLTQIIGKNVFKTRQHLKARVLLISFSTVVGHTWSTDVPEWNR